MAILQEDFGKPFEDKLTDFQQLTSPFKIYIQKEVPTLENQLEYYRKSHSTTEKKIFWERVNFIDFYY